MWWSASQVVDAHGMYAWWADLKICNMQIFEPNYRFIIIL